MRLRSFASGSSGNCIYIDEGEDRILIDAGISCKRISEGLRDTGTEPQMLSGIMITHEHIDHINGLRVFINKYRVPVFLTEGTLSEIKKTYNNDCFPDSLYNVIREGEPFFIGNLRILPLHISHDAKEPVCYRIDGKCSSVAVITDTGMVPKETENNLHNLSGIVLEANHDIRMLETGSYPYKLKRRILGESGHLSNEDSGYFLERILSPSMKFALLSHLSEENNYPMIAVMTVSNIIDSSAFAKKTEGFILKTASRNCFSEIFEV